jgi:hypothetical protein
MGWIHNHTIMFVACPSILVKSFDIKNSINKAKGDNHV